MNSAKRILLVIIVICLNRYNSKAQNLIPNPSFEDYVICPVNTDNMDNCTNWSSYGGSSDYWNACSTGGMNVPNAIFGFQYAHTGGGMAGFVTYEYNHLNQREYLGSQLLTPLIIGQKYFISFFVNFSNIPTVAIASNNLGIKLSTVSYSQINPVQPTNLANLNYSSIILDSINWTKVTGIFVADSSYDYIVVGNFFVDSLTNTINIGPQPLVSYYYVDDICLSIDSMYCENWTYTPNTIQEAQINIYPNPTEGSIFIKTMEIFNSFEIIDPLGRIHFKTKLDYVQQRFHLDLGSFSSGIYYIRFYSNDVIAIEKIIKQ